MCDPLFFYTLKNVFLPCSLFCITRTAEADISETVSGVKRPAKGRMDAVTGVKPCAAAQNAGFLLTEIWAGAGVATGVNIEPV